MELTSTAFDHEGMIPQRYTCDGENVSPALRWDDPPDETESFALVMDDPDAPMGTYVHWVIYNIPSDLRSLSEDVPGQAELTSGALQGQNSSSSTGYAGPCPPRGTHRYFFKLYALDTTLDLTPNDTNKEALLEAMDGHVLAQATLMGNYESR